MSFAQNGMKTLLIDADTRKSVMKNRGKKGKIKYGLLIIFQERMNLRMLYA